MSKLPPFPANFLWGTATSAYQIEGSPLADGAGPSIWQRFAHTPRMMVNGDTGDVACDHYRRYKEDVALMRELGMKAYRFSIAWSRIFPEGKGRVNPAGIDFYSRLVDELLAAGIEPMATLYHWDLPAALDDRGGWLNPDIAEWFGDYAATMFRALDGRVKLWATLNEPWVVTDGGYLHGALAPGHRNYFEAPIASHHLMRSHGRAVQVYRAEGKHQIGLVVNLEPKYPASQSAEDLAATQRADAYMNRQYLDPAVHGRYPEEMKSIFGPAWPEWPAEDFDLIRQPLDFIGVNYYTRNVSRHDEQSWPLKASPVKQTQATYTEPAGKSVRRRSPMCWSGSRSCTATRRSTSLKTVRRSTIHRTQKAVASATHCESSICAVISMRSVPPSRKAWMCAAISAGPSSTIWSGRWASPNALAWCTSTSKPSNAHQKTACGSTRASSRAMAPSWMTRASDDARRFPAWCDCRAVDQ